MLGDWADGESLLPRALAEGLAGLIDAHYLAPGSALPPQRELAAALGTSRGTVQSAYGNLEAGGYLEARQGSGSRVRTGTWRSLGLGSGRFASFTATPPDVIDLSSGALPASLVAREALARPLGSQFETYADTDGYFPSGLPALRRAIAEHLTNDGVPTRPCQILITSGGQQAASLAIRQGVQTGDLALVEEPTYRGALEVLQTQGVRVEAIPMAAGGIDVDLLRRAVRRRPSLVYCQTGIHNPTGLAMRQGARQALADIVNRHGIVTVEDCCSRDLTLSGPPAASLAGLVEPRLLLSVGTLSKLYWGGLRVGWVRAEEERLRSLVELRKTGDLASSVVDQLYALRLLERVAEARAQRRALLLDRLHSAQDIVERHFPNWSWAAIKGGSGLWVDTGMDALAIAEVAKRVKVKLAAGPSFSSYHGQRSMLRLPIWHTPDQLDLGLAAVAAAL
jgi:DNA-binding transcriptional MocR family regulator